MKRQTSLTGSSESHKVGRAESTALAGFLCLHLDKAPSVSLEFEVIALVDKRMFNLA